MDREQLLEIPEFVCGKVVHDSVMENLALIRTCLQDLLLYPVGISRTETLLVLSLAFSLAELSTGC